MPGWNVMSGANRGSHALDWASVECAARIGILRLPCHMIQCVMAVMDWFERVPKAEIHVHL